MLSLYNLIYKIYASPFYAFSFQDDVKNIAKDMGFTFPLRTQQLISYFMSHPLHFTPGTRFAYSNIAHLVLGEVVETASGTEHKTFLKK